MNALGMIETYGYLTAVEALDSALTGCQCIFGRCGSGKRRSGDRSDRR